jgi:hypothetical protein
VNAQLFRLKDIKEDPDQEDAEAPQYIMKLPKTNARNRDDHRAMVNKHLLWLQRKSYSNRQILILTISETSTVWGKKFLRFKWQELNGLVQKDGLVFTGWPITSVYPGSCLSNGSPSVSKSLSKEDIDIVMEKQNEDLNPDRSGDKLDMGFRALCK